MTLPREELVKGQMRRRIDVKARLCKEKCTLELAVQREDYGRARVTQVRIGTLRWVLKMTEKLENGKLHPKGKIYHGLKPTAIGRAYIKKKGGCGLINKLVNDWRNRSEETDGIVFLGSLLFVCVMSMWHISLFVKVVVA